MKHISPISFVRHQQARPYTVRSFCSTSSFPGAERIRLSVPCQDGAQRPKTWLHLQAQNRRLKKAETLGIFGEKGGGKRIVSAKTTAHDNLETEREDRRRQWLNCPRHSHTTQPVVLIFFFLQLQETCLTHPKLPTSKREAGPLFYFTPQTSLTSNSFPVQIVPFVCLSFLFPIALAVLKHLRSFPAPPFFL